MRDEDAKRRLFGSPCRSVLGHANFSAVYEVEELPDGRAFLAMAFVDGETLTARLERGAIPAAEAARLAWQIARGLERAHHSGIVHRDVKRPRPTRSISCRASVHQSSWRGDQAKPGPSGSGELARQVPSDESGS